MWRSSALLVEVGLLAAAVVPRDLSGVGGAAFVLLSVVVILSGMYLRLRVQARQSQRAERQQRRRRSGRR